MKSESAEEIQELVSRIISLIRQLDTVTVDKAVRIIANHKYIMISKDAVYRWKRGGTIPSEGVMNILRDYKKELEKELIERHIL